MQYFLIFLGGALGALLRYFCSLIPFWYELPVGTFFANIIGAFFMGLISTYALHLFKRYPQLKKAVTTGVLGALTTFSTFQFELYSFVQIEAWFEGLFYFIVSSGMGLISCGLGYKLGADLS
ncbi:fluoride efflux transporter CrcB [Staphylococcus chromogenes]|uniref:fluoride efflux transporter CrcB n=1 Tax=Staphylococcus chromogenes TaxID=46126 RepID=UPI000D1BB081|nr:fluoride efflux transporter CrcB [Staphylococcus chromogenes]MCE4966748.1 fluoride efflux transporter CrcB [Staphylococcus chromogenes]PTF74372.1 fluoride efflux transporter CrcB [Staphylococcus chromogenes]PTG50350.1 fluoride efflux transporter CrcB [Staphylococcus chromogenes]RIM07782.1 fluoride efflux transporter CrcB [Staphylococcus chromogenes]